MRSRLSVLVVVLAISLALAACAPGGAPGAGEAKKEPIKIGYIASLSGVAARDAQRDVTGARFAIEDINKAGGVLGRSLELIVRDDQTNPVAAGREARDLVVKDKVLFLAGGEVSSAAAAISEVAKELKTPYIISTAAAASLTEEGGNRYVFRSWANSRSQVGPVASYVAKQPFKRYAIVFADYSFGREVTDSFKEFLKRDNPQAEIVVELPAKLGETEFSPFINRIVAAKPDAVYLGGIYGSSLLAFVKQAAPAGVYQSSQVISFIGADDLGALGKTIPDGRHIGYNSFYANIDNTWGKEFSDRFYSATGMVSDGSSFTGYVVVKWVEAALKKAGKADAEALVDALEGLEMDTFLGKTAMRKADHQATGDYWYGIVKQAEPFPIMSGLNHTPGTSYLLPEAAIAQKRAGKK